jgi:outer membrane protein assembly factor BamB
MTSGMDGQRSGWLRSDSKISDAAMKKPGFQFLWKLKLNGQPKQLNSLTAPALLDFYIGYRGFRTLGFFGTSSDTVIAVDTDLGRVEWEKTLGSSAKTANPTLECPGGMTSAVTRRTSVGYPPIVNGGGRGFGRASGAKSAVGEPGEGAAILKEVRPQQQFRPPPSAQAAKPGRRAAPVANAFGRGIQWLDALTSDGKLHSVYVSNGAEPNPAVDFLPPNANAQGLIIFDGTAYAETVNSCGGVENGLWALDLESKKVSHWKASGSAVGGSMGPAIGPDGTFYAADGSDLVALDAGSLKVKSAYKAGAKLTSSPVVFEFKGKDLVAVAAADGTLRLLDTAKLESPLAKSDVFSSSDYATGALASWQDGSGKRWVLAPAGPAGNTKNGSITAFKVVDKNGTPTLEAAWTSREMTAPLPPIVVNGVIFALASGEFRTADAKMSAADRAKRSSNAILYALDAETGKELWNSGSTITSFAHSGGLVAGGNRVYIGTYDGTQYVFGMPMEH